jgi:hypothetical protein
MGLQSKLQTQGSVYAYGAAPSSPTTGNSTPNGPQSILVTNQSPLHASVVGTPGYSLNGDFYSQVNNNYQQYLDGTPNILPQPSSEDLNGVPPTIANHNNFTPGASTQALPYINNLPV